MQHAAVHDLELGCFHVHHGVTKGSNPVTVDDMFEDLTLELVDCVRLAYYGAVFKMSSLEGGS